MSRKVTVTLPLLLFTRNTRVLRVTAMETKASRMAIRPATCSKNMMLFAVEEKLVYNE